MRAARSGSRARATARPLGRFCAAGALLFLLGACSADSPPHGTFDGPETPTDGWPDAPANCPQPGTLKIASISSYPDPTCYTLQPFRGSAPGAFKIVARGNGGTAQPAKVASDGKFCIEVTLVASTQNTITFSPIDSTGCPGQDLKKTITHQTCASPDAGVSVVNVAQGGTVTSDSSPSKGNNAYLTDGKTSTVVEYTGGWGWVDADIWVGVALGSPVEVQKIVVKWRDKSGSGCDYGARYKIATSAFSSPGKWDLNSGSWAQLEDITSGDGGDDTFTYSTKKLAQHVALLLKVNGCTGWSETFALEELEVWAQDPKATPTPPADKCP